MPTDHRTIRFGQHALAVLGASTCGATAYALAAGVQMAVLAGDRWPGVTWLAEIAVVTWLGVFILALPSVGLVLSVLWPITRRPNGVTALACVAACMTIGLLFLPLGHRPPRPSTPAELGVMMLLGAIVGLA